MSKLKPVLVIWEDASGDATWHDPAEKVAPVIVHSVGWLLHRGKKCVRLVSGVGNNGEVLAETRIPTAMVRRIVKLKKVAD